MGARLILGGVLLVAGVLKVSDPETAAQAVRAYELLPPVLADPVGWGLPFLEIAVGLLLILGFGVRVTAASAAALMVVFLIGVASAWARGLAIDCGCFGGGGKVDPGQTQYLQEIVRDVGLLALAVWLCFNPASKFALESDPHAMSGETAS
nr:MauE/DoxX family redox-associated membrane protein [Kribbella sandramycini]